MDRITAFNRTNLVEFRSLVEAKLQEVEEQTGVVVRLGNIRFDEGQFTTKLTASVKNFRGSQTDGPTAEYGRDYDRNRERLGLPKNLIGTKFQGMGGEYTFVGTKASNRKYPVIARKPTGGLVKMTVDSVLSGLAKTGGKKKA